MITLITGLPGAGKTLYALCHVRDLAAREGREVYYSGIADLKLPWIEHEFTRWMELPPNSIIVVDEVQRLMRPRANGSQVPEFVSQLETHRHKGVDIVFITQHPMLLDQNARRLVGRHLHVVRKFGSKHATVHEWPQIKEGCDKSRADSIKHQFSYPKEAFGWYKSAEVHTVKRNVPWRIYALIAAPILALALGAFAVTRGLNFGGAKEGSSGLAAGSGSAMAARTASNAPKLTKAEYIAQYEPRVSGLEYTAPVYDEVTKPTRAPYPAACVSSAEKCSCYTQQGTRLQTPEELCRSIVAGGFFQAWEDRFPEQRHQAVDRMASAQPLLSEPSPRLVYLGGPQAEAARLRGQAIK